MKKDKISICGIHKLSVNHTNQAYYYRIDIGTQSLHLQGLPSPRDAPETQFHLSNTIRQDMESINQNLRLIQTCDLVQ